MEGSEDSPGSRVGARSAETAKTAVRFDGALEALVERHAHPTTLIGVVGLGPVDIPAARDHFVGVPVLLSPSGRLFVLRTHSHAAVARTVLTEAGLPFDADHPDRTLGAELGWVMLQAAGREGARIQVDRRPTPAQRAVLEDLLLFERVAGRRVTLHWGRPSLWSTASFDWVPNPHFVDSSDPEQIRRILSSRVAVG